VISVCNFFCENGTRACTWGEDELAGESVTGGAAVRAKKYLNFYMQMSVANFGIKMNFYVYMCVWRHSARSQKQAYSNKYSNYIPCNLGQGICL